MATSLTNPKTKRVPTHEGALVKDVNAKEKLVRTVSSCLLFEDNFYENGEDVATRIKNLVKEIVGTDPLFVMDLAIKARNVLNLRHAPLLLAREMARHDKSRPLLATLLPNIINRADELAEFMAMYWSEGRVPIAHPVRKGLSASFNKFKEYHFAKYNRDKDIKIRDVLRMVHPVPKDDAQSVLFKKIKEGTLETPRTWEVLLSASKDPKATWTELLNKKELGAMALLRNLRNMTGAGVNRALIKKALSEASTAKLLPFRFISAASTNPHLEDVLEGMMLKNLEGVEGLKGRTLILADVSGSMSSSLSSKSTMSRCDAAGGLAVIARELCEDVAVYSFGNGLYTIPNRRGFALSSLLKPKNEGTNMGAAIRHLVEIETFDRIIVLTDEQSHDRIPSVPAGARGYIINVAVHKNGVGYDGGWVHVHGWSESVVRFIQEHESM